MAWSLPRRRFEFNRTRARSSLGLALIALAFVGCFRDRSAEASPSEATRALGAVRIGRLELRFSATKATIHRDPCEPTFFAPRACVDSTIRTAVEATIDGRPVDVAAYDPGLTATDRIVVAERDSRSFRRVDREANERLSALAITSCADETHAAYRVGTPESPGWYTLVAFRDGVVAVHAIADPESSSCDAVLAEGAGADARYARDFEQGRRYVFDFLVRHGSIARAADFAFAHPFEIDVLRESYPLVDEIFFERLASEAASDPELGAYLVGRLLDPSVAFASGRRGNRELDAFVVRLVRTLTPGQRTELAHALGVRCGAGCDPLHQAIRDEAIRELPDGSGANPD